jgi:NAD(P) transhydrogenase subunit alpha
MQVAVAKESFPEERRVALVPAAIKPLVKAGVEVLIEAGAGEAAGFADEAYRDAGARLTTRDEAFAADCLLAVRTCGAAGTGWAADQCRLREGQILIGSCDPLSEPAACQEAAERGVTLFALELVPRITRAQSMDVLSSMANIAGYRAVLLAATALPRVVPMMTTAAGTITAAKVLILGAGVAGLQAIATAKRLGGQVQAYDVRPAVREQVQSLGAKFVELDLETGSSEAAGGYAKAMGEDFYARQREQLGRIVAECDIVVSTAAIPGKAAPILVTLDAVSKMRAGSVIVDGVTIMGPTNLVSDVPFHTSQLYARNISTYLLHLLKLGLPQIALDDEICRDTLVARGGQLVHNRVRAAAGLPPLESEPKPTAST